MGTISVRISESSDVHRDVELEGRLICIGRDPSCEISFDTVRFPKVSGIHCHLEFNSGSLRLVHRSQSNKTLLNDQPIEGSAEIKVGDRIRLGFTGPTLTVLRFSPTEKQSAKSSDVSPSLVLSNPDRPSRDEHPEPEGGSGATVMASNIPDWMKQSLKAHRFTLGKVGTIGRDPQRCNHLLDHTHVSRQHAKIVQGNAGYTISDLASSNGTFVNGSKISGNRNLQAGDVIDIGPFSLVFDGRDLVSRSRENNIQLVVNGAGRVVNDTTQRRQLTLLHDVTFVLNPGEFLCIIGPSGSGKSTLLSMASGRTLPSMGTVTINERDLHRNFAALKEDLAVVPQNCVLHDGLTVDQCLRYTASLRLPPDTSSSELTQQVDKILESVGLTHRRGVKIRQLSGGQLKRAGLACELMSGPSLLFLDEVTSGLDEQADGEMMRLFRSLADTGKSLVCVTHNLSHVEENCHLIAVLTVGGRLAFYGSPQDALKYFQVKSLADIYPALAKQRPEDWASAFARSSYYKANILGRLPSDPPLPDVAKPSLKDVRLGSVTRQFLVLVSRYVAIWRGDLYALGAIFGQAILVIFLLCLVFGSLDDDTTSDFVRQGKIRNLLFLVCVSAFWLGCNNCVKEIVKERLIYQRERNFNLIPEAYLASKLVIMATVGVLQAILLGCVVYMWCGMPGNFLSHLGLLGCLSLAGTCLGLAISAVAKSEELAVAIVPIAIIPQIILAGVVASLGDVAEGISRCFVSVYWGQKGAESLLASSDRIAADFEPSYLLCLMLLGLHTIAYLCLAGWGVRWLNTK